MLYFIFVDCKDQHTEKFQWRFALWEDQDYILGVFIYLGISKGTQYGIMLSSISPFWEYVEITIFTAYGFELLPMPYYEHFMFCS